MDEKVGLTLHFRDHSVNFSKYKVIVELNIMSKYLSLRQKVLTITSVTLICHICRRVQIASIDSESNRSICISCNMDL
jgi:hypothetical protein